MSSTTDVCRGNEYIPKIISNYSLYMLRVQRCLALEDHGISIVSTAATVLGLVFETIPPANLETGIDKVLSNFVS